MAANSNDSSERTAAAAPIDQRQLDAARRRLRPELPLPTAPWSACAAPWHQLVIDAAGCLRGCEYAAGPVAGAEAPLADWRGPAFGSLRDSLAAGQLPVGHCRQCSRWANDDLWAAMPAIRDQDRFAAVASPESPDTLVVRVTSGATPARTTAELAPLLASIAVLVIDVDDPLADAAVHELLALARAGGPRLVVRSRRFPAGVAELVRGFARVQFDLELEHPDDEALAAARTAAHQIGADLRARFCLAPHDWFEFEEVARLCTRHAVPLELRVLDRDGRVPLAGVAVASLDLVRRAVVGSWPRCGGPERPRAIAEGAFDVLCQEVRMLVQRAAEASEDGSGVPLQLPSLGHAWNVDRERRSFWWRLLFECADTDAVRAWVAAEPGGDAKDSRLQQSAVLRTLLHRQAWTDKAPAVVERLRRLYAPQPARTQLQLADAELAAELDLRPYGGPWAAPLGLAPGAARKRPFTIGKPVPATAAADLTVLIPSFRHEAFIAQTIGSVLAQRYPNFRLLVVDDRSPDATVARARAIEDPRLEVRVNDENAGLGNSVLRALDGIDTPFVAILNSDDLLHPDHLARCRAQLVDDPAAMLVATDLVLIDGKGNTLAADTISYVLDGKRVYDWVRWYERELPPPGLPPAKWFGALLERNYLVTSSNLVMRTEWLRSRATSLRQLKYCLDWRLFLAAAMQGALRHLRAPLVAYRLHTSNTVWFDAERRSDYFLEVNRVAAESLQELGAQPPTAGAPQVESVLDAVAHHATKNPETDGFAVFLNAAFDPLRLETLARTSPAVQAAVRQLGRAVTVDAPPVAYHRDRERLLGELAREQAWVERDRRRWLQLHVEDLQAKARDVEARLRDAVGLHASLDRARNELGVQLAASNQAHERASKELADERDASSRRAAELTALQAELADLQQRWSATRADLEQAMARVDAAERRGAELRQELTVSTAQRTELTRQLTAAEHQCATLRASREFRTGDLLWNRLPLGYASRRLKKWLRRSLDAKDRLGLRTWKGHGKAPLAVVASVRQWPVYSQTFCYQEMLGLARAGFDVRMFHWDHGNRAHRHAAFQALERSRLQLQSVGEIHDRDWRHFERTLPGRLRALLERIAAATGRDVASLEREPLVRQACTFARMAQLARVDYLHTYFFYDQTFCAMVAAWLLKVPRGITCYADHALDDYPLKLVPLHLELADLVVATSERTRLELSRLAGSRHDAKIVVKPNGVDVQRFSGTPARRRDGAFELAAVCRLEPKKGLEYLALAVAQLAARDRRVACHVVGAVDPGNPDSAPYMRELHRRIAELGVQDHFEFHGVVTQEALAPLLARVHAFVAPAVELPNGDKDGIPTAMLEAMASALPVIATDAGSIPEAVTDGEHGIVVGQRDAAALAAAIERLAADDTLRERLGAAARARCEREFDTLVTEKRLHERVASVIAANTGSG